MLIDVEHRVLVNGSVTSSLTSHVDSAKVLALITDDELMREAARRGMGLSQYARNPPSEDDVARSLPTGALKRVLEAREGTGERVDEEGKNSSISPSPPGQETSARTGAPLRSTRVSTVTA